MTHEDACLQRFLDEEDESDADFSDFLTITGEILKPLERGLVEKLNMHPNGNFSVSEFSLYIHDVWTLGRMKNSSPINIKFDRNLEGSNSLKRALVFYMLPEFNPFGLVRSYSTTNTQSRVYNILEKYVFSDNFLPATKEGIALVTTQLLNDALNRAREAEAARHYYSLFFMLRFWENLSAQNFLPDEFKLSTNFSKIDNIERQKDVRAHFTGTMQTWLPFSETDLESLLNYSLFWLDEAMPALAKARDYIELNKLDKSVKGDFSRSFRWAEAEEHLNITLRDTSVLTLSHASWMNNGIVRYRYYWVSSYAVTLDKIRNGIFVLIALLTGLRIRELCSLTFDDIYIDGNGEYWINAVRFKTSRDPNYQGEVDTLPLPKFIGEKVREFNHLRNIYKFNNQNYIFKSNKSRRILNFPTSRLINAICSELMDDTQVDRIHAHRFRKTIAEILIHRDERNIHIIRLLFGHKSYAMTLRYISRNPYLVASVAAALEHNFAQEFHEIVTSISKGAYSGPAADRIATHLQKRPDAFSGKQLKLSIFHYVAHLLEAGQPIFIQRVSVGTYCLTDTEYSETFLPPCLLNRKTFAPGEPIVPDSTNCQPDCVHAIVLGKAKTSIESNIKFYSNLLEHQSGGLTQAVKSMLLNKIAANEAHLHNLNQNPAQFGDQIIARSSS